MKIFLSHKKTPDDSYKWASHLNVFNGIALDSEAKEILCDDFISAFSYDDLGPLIQKICAKIRLKGQLVIKEADINITTRKYYVEEVSLEELNNILFGDEQKRKSVLDLNSISKAIPDSFEIEEKYFDNSTGSIVIKCRRIR